MAQSSERKKFSVSNPGAKEYLIVGGVALAGALVYLYLKNRSSASTAAGPAAAPARSSTPTGMSTDDLKIWIMDHASSPKKPKKKTAAKSPVSPAK